MTREEIIEKVNTVLADEFEVDASTLQPDSNLKETLSLDSLSLVDLVAIIQRTYKIKIPVADFVKIKTLGDLYDYIEEKVAQ